MEISPGRQLFRIPTYLNSGLDNNTFILINVLPNIIYRDSQGIIISCNSDNGIISSDIASYNQNDFGFISGSLFEIHFTTSGIAPLSMIIRIKMYMTGVYSTDNPIFVYSLDKEKESTNIKTINYNDSSLRGQEEFKIERGNNVYFGWKGGIGFNGTLNVEFRYISST